MPRKRESFKYALNKRAFRNTKNNKNDNTETTYKRGIDQFVGKDNISDFITNLVKPYLCAYTEQF